MKKSLYKKIGALIACGSMAFAFALVLGGCGNEEEALPEEDVKYEIALVTDDSLIMDGGHSETAWNAITEFGGTHGISHKYYKAAEQSDSAFTETMKTAINKGAKVIIIDNSAMADAVYEMQEVYPEINFILMDADLEEAEDEDLPINGNTAAVNFDSGQAGYLAGYAAVIDGSTELGFIGQAETDDVKAFGYGYVMGAERAAGETLTEVTMDYEYCADPSDRDAVYEQAEKMYEDGAQVIFAAGGHIQDAVIEAAETKDGKFIGSCTDQSGKSDKVMTSAIYNIRDAIKELLGDYTDGKFPGGKVIQYNARNEGIGLELRNNNISNLTKKQYEDIYKDLADGVIKIRTDNVKSAGDIITVNLTFK